MVDIECLEVVRQYMLKPPKLYILSVYISCDMCFKCYILAIVKRIEFTSIIIVCLKCVYWVLVKLGVVWCENCYIYTVV